MTERRMVQPQIRSECSANWPRAVVVLILATVLAGGCGTTGTTKAEDHVNALPVAVVKVTRQDLASTLRIASEFLPFQEISVYAKVSGYIQKLYVDWGTHVRQGQLLAVLEIPELQQQLQLDGAAVGRSQQDLARAREELTQSESKYQVADLTYQRLATVMKTRPGLVAQEEVDVANGKDLEAKAGVSSSKDMVSGAEQALLAAKAQLEKDRSMYSYARITAPFDGVVTEIDAYGGALLPAGTSSNKGAQALCHLSQNNLLRLVIPVPESAVPDIRLGSSVDVRVSALNKTFKGTVARFADQVDMATRTMHTEIDVPNPKLEIVPGMYAEATIVLKNHRGVLAAPVQALDHEENGVSVLVVDKNNKIQERTVQLGIETPDQVEVVSGLAQDDMVVVGNRSQLRAGMIVQPKLISASSASGGK
ncbi:MAG TPA: efflux RND transporter periplasmic adaptor subunit [Candidatus Solibacter sp.]|nr:efflux RND transporter periplasmic adaptor subunit [Candidatus Solibacter sp.]